MRIAVFTSQFPSRLCTFFTRDIRTLVEAGFEVDIYPIYPLDPNLWRYIPEILNESVFPRSRVHHISIQDSLLTPSNISLREIPIYFKDIISITASAVRYGFKPLAKSIYSAIKAWGWAHRNTRKYDHILAYWGNYAATSAYMFHRLTNGDSAFSIFLHAGTDLYRDQVFLKQKLLYADNIFVVCDFNRQFLQNLYPSIFPKISNSIYLYHLGLDLEEFPYSPDNRPESKIIAVGALTKLKGFDFLLYAVKDLISRGIGVEIDLIGDGEERASLELLAQQLEIADRIKFFGWLPFKEVKNAMLQAALLVHPSSDIGDAVPTVIKEAMALGTPVVASQIAGIPEILDYGRCGELVPPKEVKALSDAIEKMLRNEPLRKNYAKLGRRFAEDKFDLWRNGRKLADILHTTKRRLHNN
jgi:colanic acid/amylovoran biosynthesis glycosyltransferase